MKNQFFLIDEQSEKDSKFGIKKASKGARTALNEKEAATLED